MCNSPVFIQMDFYRTIATLAPFKDVLQKAYDLPSRPLEKYSVELINL